MKTIPENKYLLCDEQGRKYLLGNHLDGISCCMEFMQQVLYTKDLCYQAQTGSKLKRFPKLTLLGEHLEYLRKYAGIFSRSITFHPALAFFFEAYRSHLISDIASHYLPTDVVLDGQVVSDVFDDFVESIRREAKYCGLKKKISDWDSKIKKNEKRIAVFERQLFDLCSRVYVVRLDLEYLKTLFSAEDIARLMVNDADQKALDWEWYTNGEDISEAGELRALVPFEEVQRDRQRLFANMKGKPSLFEHLVGYVWRIECTPRVGYHLHLALFFKGAKVDDSSNLAERIGEYWRKSITSGRGRFQNVNSDWSADSLHYGIGTINHFDVAKRANLRDKVLKYLCKGTQLVQALPYPGCNLFGTGFAHRDRSKGRGRPRTRGDVEGNQPPSGAL